MWTDPRESRLQTSFVLNYCSQLSQKSPERHDHPINAMIGELKRKEMDKKIPRLFTLNDMVKWLRLRHGSPPSFSERLPKWRELQEPNSKCEFSSPPLRNWNSQFSIPIGCHLRGNCRPFGGLKNGRHQSWSTNGIFNFIVLP